MFVSPAYAQAAGAAAQPGLLESVAPFVLILGVFYILLIRPQQKKMSAHRTMLAGIRRGDRVVTAGGIHATVTKVEGDEVLECEIAEGIKVKVDRNLVSHLQAKTEPVSGKKGGDDTSAGNEGKAKKGGLRDKLIGKG